MNAKTIIEEGTTNLRRIKPELPSEIILTISHLIQGELESSNFAWMYTNVNVKPKI